MSGHGHATKLYPTRTHAHTHTHTHTHSLTPRSTVLLQKLIIFQSRNSPHFMEPEGSLPHSQVPATCPYPEPARSSPYPTFYFLKINFIIILPSTPGSSKWSLSLRFPLKPYTQLTSPPYVPHAPPISFFSILSSEKYTVSSTDH